MSDPNQDIWSQWLLHHRHGRDPEQLKAVMGYLRPVRDTVLSNADLREGELLLDVGCGDGLIGFGALEHHSSSRVVFSDISEDLLSHVETVARSMNVLDRSRFLKASAANLSAIDDASVDVVTTRSVLIYVAQKQQAFREFHRVLKSGGRLSIFEPINRFTYPEPVHAFCGYDVTPVVDLAEKVKAVFSQFQPPDSDPMLDFDERDLIAMTEQAGFNEIHLELQIDIRPKAAQGSCEPKKWKTFLNSAGNPKIPTIGEVMDRALTKAEADVFATHLRPLVESRQGIEKQAVAYLWAIKESAS